MLLTKPISSMLKIVALMLCIFSVQAKSNAIIVYTISTCPHCQEAKEYLDSKGIQYVDYEIDTSMSARKKFEALHGKYVPLFFIGNQRIEGFKENALNNALRSQGLLNSND